ncbi:DNA-3-methyladenine glycosylase [uncultured Clostridium sp.]|jgi:DNA-3-methyladenine glycosylase|uniref:DNA-3-methyladenine glycosylase n=1 Tax=uncultured Clostridium sp. TaxID=59620 RepID=UPI0025D2E5DF|nr:DNA-3-methyladenine glycosylase [uncultured Clostridium sp.]
MIINKEFYNRSAVDVAKDLLGKVLVREVDGKILKGKIVETEAYIGESDKACHAYNGRRTKRTEPLYGEGGISYIYFIYGLYHCLNVVTREENVAEAVLIRALEPLNEFDYISQIRYKKDFNELTKTQIKNLANGPSKLCLAYLIDKNLNEDKLYEKGELYIEEHESEYFEIVETKRIGIDYSEEAKDFLWRFYIKNNNFISKK